MWHIYRKKVTRTFWDFFWAPIPFKQYQSTSGYGAGNSMSSMKLSNLSLKKWPVWSRKEKEKIINNLQWNTSKMSNELEALKESLDWEQQYSRWNCILIHGISEQTGTDLDEQALKMIRKEFREAVEKSKVDQMHRTGTFKKDKNKCRSIIIKFSRYTVCDKV